MSKESSDQPLLFSNNVKLNKQMRKRGWTEQQIREALRSQPISCEGKDGRSLRYVHPGTGKSVVVDQKTGQIFHLGGEGFKYDV